MSRSLLCEKKPHLLVVQELNVHFVIRISTSIISTQEELLPADWKHNRHANFFVPPAAIIAAYGSGHYFICKVAEGGDLTEIDVCWGKFTYEKESKRILS